MVNRRFFPRVVQALVIVVIAVTLSRVDFVRRFYARHAPVWGARGSVPPPSEFAARVVQGAREQIGTVYDDAYIPIDYPSGDVSPARGACSDVVVRALRRAGIDLQQLICEDILRTPDAYPHLETRGLPDSNIDHRRCVNQMSFLQRHGMTLTTEVSAQTRADWQPGDLVYWRQPFGREHVGVISDRTNANSWPLVIHNGSVCIEQDCLTNWEIIGHFRAAR